jgi:SAM-dependent methyltransferase
MREPHPGVPESLFHTVYQERRPPWDIDGPQPAFLELEAQGRIRGSVLDVGCGTGEHVLHFAKRGNDSWGIDLVPAAIDQARKKARERQVSATFLAADALELERLGRMFDTVIDSGLFHVFGDEARPRYVQSLARVLPEGGLLHVLAFSERQPGDGGPRRVTERELRDAFRDGWAVIEIRPSRFEIRADAGVPGLGQSAHAWLATFERLGTDGKR